MNNKRIFKLIILILVLFISGTYSIYILAKSDSEIPDVYYSTISLEKKSLRSMLKDYDSCTIFYIMPTCEACEEINNELVKKTSKKKKRIIVAQYIKGFDYSKYEKVFKLKDTDEFLIDTENTFPEDFNLGFSFSVPTILRLNNFNMKQMEDKN